MVSDLNQYAYCLILGLLMVLHNFLYELNTLLVDYSEFGFVSMQFKNDIFLKYCFVEDDDNIDKKIFNYLDSLCVDDDDDCRGYLIFFFFVSCIEYYTTRHYAYFNSNFQGFKENPYFEEIEYNRIY
jgi:hypothetical protein